MIKQNREKRNVLGIRQPFQSGFRKKFAFALVSYSPLCGWVKELASLFQLSSGSKTKNIHDLLVHILPRLMQHWSAVIGQSDH